MAIAEDASTPAPVAGTGQGTLTTAAFSPPSGSLLVAMVAGEWSESAMSVAITDNALNSWHQGAYAQGFTEDGGVAGVFFCYLAAAESGLKVTATFTNLAGGRLLDVRVLTGASAQQSSTTGWARTPSSLTTDGTITVTTTQAGSMVYGMSSAGEAMASFNGTAATTVLTLHQDPSTADYTAAASWRSVAATVSPGNVVLGGTWAKNEFTNIAGFEVLPAGATDTAPVLPTFVDGSVPTARDMHLLTTSLSNLYNWLLGGFRPKKPLTLLGISTSVGTVPDSTTTFIPFDTAFINTDNQWNPIAQTQLFVNTGGVYRLHLQIQLSIVTATPTTQTTSEDPNSAASSDDSEDSSSSSSSSDNSEDYSNSDGARRRGVLAPSASGGKLGLSWNDDSSFELDAIIMINGTTPSTFAVAYANAYGTSVGCSATLPITAGSYIYPGVTQHSGSNCTIEAVQFCAEWLSL